MCVCYVGGVLRLLWLCCNDLLVGFAVNSVALMRISMLFVGLFVFDCLEVGFRSLVVC